VKVFFAGTPVFAVPVLEEIARNFEVCGVLTALDKPQGRGKKLVFSPVKEKALELMLKVYQPASLDEQAIEEIVALSPDILAVAAYGKIFKESFLEIFPKGGINLHPSLLPKYRGPAPIPAMILAGDMECGITVQKLALKMDAGDILAQAKFRLAGHETTDSLTHTCSIEGAKMMADVLAKIESGTIESLPQDEGSATYCKLVRKEFGLIDWRDSAVSIERKIRAYYPWPRAFTFFAGQQLTISEACVAEKEKDATFSAGSVLGVDKQCGILVKTGMGILGVRRLQIQAKHEMDFQSFLNGNKIVDRLLGE
jgi:methionyl-tRNA formyltransferase